jgi:hypothetical protein
MALAREGGLYRGMSAKLLQTMLMAALIFMGVEEIQIVA